VMQQIIDLAQEGKRQLQESVLRRKEKSRRMVAETT